MDFFSFLTFASKSYVKYRSFLKFSGDDGYFDFECRCRKRLFLTKKQKNDRFKTDSRLPTCTSVGMQ